MENNKKMTIYDTIKRYGLVYTWELIQGQHMSQYEFFKAVFKYIDEKIS